METAIGMGDLEAFKLLGTSLALGLLIGLERGWHGREISEGHRIAGIRTFALIGLLGGLFAMLSAHIGMWLLGIAYIGLLVLLIAAYYKRSSQSEDVGITSMVAALLTFGFGAFAVLGSVTVAVSAAVFTALILGMKPVLHEWILKMERTELYATLKLLLISVVVLPVLPDKGYGPLEALNPYQIWWMVVLIAGISFAGYFAMKIGGARHGALLTGVLGGLAASTAVTLSLSRLARKQATINNALAAGILAACATMFPRTLLVALILSQDVFWGLLPSLLVMGVLSYLAAYIFWLKARSAQPEPLVVKNPFQISMALKFGALLALILVLLMLVFLIIIPAFLPRFLLIRRLLFHKDRFHLMLL